MPPKQVYGKRSRAIYDPFQAFVSPQRPAPKGNIREQGVFVAEVVEELSSLTIEEKAGRDARKSGRKALGEKSANETVDPVKTALECGKTKRRKKVIEESKDVENDVELSGKRVASQRGDIESKPQVQRTSRGRDNAGKEFVADNVPLFVDGNGYETGDEGSQGQSRTRSPLLPRRRTDETSHDSETPSISVLPPTPPAEEDAYTAHCSSLLSLSSHGIINFTEWSNQLSAHFHIAKIAEASFGEVYRLSLLEDHSSFSQTDESVLKIIALKPPEPAVPPPSRKKERAAAIKKIEAMSKVEDVANEVKLLQRMSTIPGFTNFRDVRIMQGRPPQAFIKAFRDFNAEQKARKGETSVFPDPAKKASYPDDQLWAVIEMQDAGVDLERYIERGECRSIWAVWDVFWQVVLTLAKGEEGAEFEHRDLHLGNICVRGEQPSDSPSKQTEIDTKRKLNFTGLETTIIDYTISRALLDPGTKETAFHDLSMPSSASIFEGDSTEEYQYDIYRYMRGCVLVGDPYYTPPESPAAPPTTPWSLYTPRTNLIWLHYTLHTLLEALLWPSSTKAPARKKNAGADHTRWKRANDLEHVLLRVQELLDPGEVCGIEGLGSAGALVGLAIEEGWLDVRDVIGEEEGDEDGEELVGRVEGLRIDCDSDVVGEGETLAAVVAGDANEDAGPRQGTRSRRKRG